MVGVTALLVGYVIGQFLPETFSAAVSDSPLFMIVFCVVFAFGVAYIAYPRRQRHDGGECGDQRHSDLGADHLLRHGHRYRVNHPEGSRGLTLDPDGNADQRRARQVRMRQGRARSRTRSRRNYVVATKRRRRRRQAVHDYASCARLRRPRRRRIRRHPRSRRTHVSVPHGREVGRRAARVLLHDHPGVYCDSDSGRLRVRDGDGRRGQECETRYSAGGHSLAADSGVVLLPDRILCGELLHNNGYQICNALGLGGARSAT